MANNNTAFIPELWAQESLRILEANTVMTNLVYRDFNSAVASFGQTVNTRKPAEFIAGGKIDGEDVTNQDATATNIAVVLNHHLHTSFVIFDGEESKSFQELRAFYLEPAMLSISQKIDEILCGQVYQFLANSVGRLGLAVSEDTVIDAQGAMNILKVPFANRNLVVPPAMHSDLLRDDIFVSAERVGDNGTALREGSLGTKFGFKIFMDQNMPSIPTAGLVKVLGAINLVAGYSAGTTTFVVDGFSAAIINGSYITIAGDDTPLLVSSTVGGATPTSITVATASKRDVVDNAVVTVYTPTAINFGAGYSAGWHKEIVVDSAPTKIGQLLTVGANSYASTKSLTAPSATILKTDKNLVASVADNDVVGLGPAGNYGLAFTKNALAMVNRPLALPMAGSVLSAVASYNDLSIRVVIDYDSKVQGHRVTVDMLMGTKVLDSALGTVVLG